MVQEAAWIGVLFLVGIAAWLDWRSRRIPNWLTVSGITAGIGVNGLLDGWGGVKSALLGLGVVLLLLLPFVILRGLGAGDWKLMGAVGSLLGVKQALLILFATICCAGLIAIVQVTWRKHWRGAVGNLTELVIGIFTFGFRPHPVISLDNPRLLTLPFGVAAGMAAGVCYLLRLMSNL